MSDNFEKLRNLLMAVYTAYTRAQNTGYYQEIDYSSDGMELYLTASKERTAFTLRIGDHSDVIDISISTVISEMDDGVSYRCNQYLKRAAFFSFVVSDEPNIVFIMDGPKKYYDIPLYCNEGELFQFSTVKDVPDMSTIEYLRNIHEMYNFVEKGLNFNVTFQNHDKLSEPRYIERVEKKLWGMINVCCD